MSDISLYGYGAPELPILSLTEKWKLPSVSLKITAWLARDYNMGCHSYTGSWEEMDPVRSHAASTISSQRLIYHETGRAKKKAGQANQHGTRQNPPWGLVARGGRVIHKDPTRPIGEIWSISKSTNQQSELYLYCCLIPSQLMWSPLFDVHLLQQAGCVPD